MKTRRHLKILEIIESRAIQTQEELAEELRKNGFDVTQATVSRDIRELRLVKVPWGDEAYRYSVPREHTPGNVQERMKRLFKDSVTHIDNSENLIIIRTLPGTAHAVASTIDNANWPEIIGTVAGDDTILVVVKPKDLTEAVQQKFESLLG
ncbi:MAG: arginine repressor [Firmicutes bacterium]|nr:arginine repressor [Bacillota bacterium]